MKAPLLMHEHLIGRYEKTEAAYSHYDKAAGYQFEDDDAYRNELEKAAECFLSHLDDVEPVEDYLKEGRRALGLDISSYYRLRQTKKGIRDLAALMHHFEASRGPLPAFQQLQNVFLEPFRTHWYGDREHDWAAGSPRFRRFSLREPGVWTAAPTIGSET